MHTCICIESLLLPTRCAVLPLGSDNIEHSSWLTKWQTIAADKTLTSSKSEQSKKMPLLKKPNRKPDFLFSHVRGKRRINTWNMKALSLSLCLFTHSGLVGLSSPFISKRGAKCLILFLSWEKRWKPQKKPGRGKKKIV